MNQPDSSHSKPDFSGKHPARLGGIMDGLFRSLGLTKRYHGWLVVQKWPDLVGDFIATRTKAHRFEDGILWVSCEDPVLRQELLGNQQQLMEKIKSLPQGYVVKELRFVGSRRGRE